MNVLITFPGSKVKSRAYSFNLFLFIHLFVILCRRDRSKNLYNLENDVLLISCRKLLSERNVARPRTLHYLHRKVINSIAAWKPITCGLYSMLCSSKENNNREKFAVRKAPL